MRKVEQDVMCVLLRALLERKLITQEIHDKARERILDTREWPAFFSPGADGGKEESHGCT